MDTFDRVLKGILDGSRAFIGPEIVQFDITNRCNNNCICCWNNSPLLGQESPEKKIEKESELPFDLIKKTIGELKELGAKTLFFAGGGEPFVHPQIMKILSFAKESGMRIFINSNFTLIDKEMAQELVKLKVEHIHVSLLSGTAKTYSLVHPNKTEEVFYNIKELLHYIARVKREMGQYLHNPLPHINLYYVVFNKNYKEIDKIVDLAFEVKADSIEFTPIDVIPGKTDVLLLNREQIEQVSKEVLLQLKRIEKYNVNEPAKIQVAPIHNFLTRINSSGASENRYETETVTAQPCYAGWGFLRILANGNVNPCLKAHRISVGNIYNQPITEIWNSPEQLLFRRKSFKLDGNDNYFRMIGNDPSANFGCLNTCDNIQINLDMHKRYAKVLRDNGRIK